MSFGVYLFPQVRHSLIFNMAVQAHLYSGNPSLPTVPGFEGGACFGGLQNPLQTQFPLHQVTQNQRFDCCYGVAPCSGCHSFLRVAFSQAMDAQLALQTQELDCILDLQVRIFFIYKAYVVQIVFQILRVRG